MIQSFYSSLMSRRALLALAGAAIFAPSTQLAAAPRRVTWDMLIPPGVPYSEIIGEGELDEINDTWNPIFDANATKVNEDLSGAYIRMPGYIVPLEMSAAGTTAFILVPYVGACVHTPPPPPNQLVYTTIDQPWPVDDPWNAVWVTGTMQTQLRSTGIAQTGYALAAEKIELFTW